jgi:hypothetical protein
MIVKTISIQIRLPGPDENAPVAIDAVYDPKHAKDLSGKLDAAAKAHLAEALKPVLE